LACLQIALVNALRAHLRKQDAAAAARPYLAPADAEAALGDGSDGRNVPSALLKVMGLRLRDAFAAGRLDPIRLSALDASLSEMTDLLGACERIKNTPLPRQYDTVPQLAIYAYSVLLPLGLVQSLGWWTPLVSSLITFVFIAIDSIGSNIEDPFENTLHDVPMTALCRTIEIDLRRLVGETEGLPRPVDASRGVLM
jgi:putative membrane protein